MRIAVIGGGIAGLAAAYEIEKARRSGAAVEYTLFEERPRLGGSLASEIVSGAVLERGPDSFLTEKPAAAELCRELGLGGEPFRKETVLGESDETVNRRIKAAIAHDLIPVFCVGERLEDRQAGKTFEVVGTQLTSGLVEIELKDAKKLIVAYEPVWAIGTGHTASPEQAQEVHAFIRERLASLYGPLAAGIRILYGGSVKPSNAGELMLCPDIDGSLVGGASLTSADFLGIIRASIA